jgi:hypothetical protein
VRSRPCAGPGTGVRRILEVGQPLAAELLVPGAYGSVPHFDISARREAFRAPSQSWHWMARRSRRHCWLRGLRRGGSSRGRHLTLTRSFPGTDWDHRASAGQEGGTESWPTPGQPLLSFPGAIGYVGVSAPTPCSPSNRSTRIHSGRYWGGGMGQHVLDRLVCSRHAPARRVGDVDRSRRGAEHAEFRRSCPPALRPRRLCARLWSGL